MGIGHLIEDIIYYFKFSQVFSIVSDTNLKNTFYFSNLSLLKLPVVQLMQA